MQIKNKQLPSHKASQTDFLRRLLLNYYLIFHAWYTETSFVSCSESEVTSCCEFPQSNLHHQLPSDLDSAHIDNLFPQISAYIITFLCEVIPSP